MKCFVNDVPPSSICWISWFVHASVTSPAKQMLPPKGTFLPISKLHSILAVANLLAHNNKSQIGYCGQISLQSAAVNCRFSDNLTLLGVTFILLAMVQEVRFTLISPSQLMGSTNFFFVFYYPCVFNIRYFQWVFLFISFNNIML